MVTVDVFSEGLDEILHVAEDTAEEPILGQITEEALNHLQPRATGGSAVHMEMRMTTHPARDPRMFVSCVVVHDHLDLFVGRNHVIMTRRNFSHS